MGAASAGMEAKCFMAAIIQPAWRPRSIYTDVPMKLEGDSVGPLNAPRAY
jgi:hypothetical protein